jgi:hypothetical protein
MASFSKVNRFEERKGVEPSVPFQVRQFSKLLWKTDIHVLSESVCGRTEVLHGEPSVPHRRKKCYTPKLDTGPSRIILAKVTDSILGVTRSSSRIIWAMT